MKKVYKSEETVKKALKVKDFKKMPKSKIKRFTRIMGKVDKDVAISTINQIPNFEETAQLMIEGLMGMCSQIVKNSTSGRDKVIESYMTALRGLEEELKRKWLRKKDREKIISEMIKIAEKIESVNDKHNSFLKDIFNGVIGFFGLIGIGVYAFFKKRK